MRGFGNSAPTEAAVSALEERDRVDRRPRHELHVVVARADRKRLGAFFRPVGTVLRILEGPHAGVYTVMDTGSAVKGRRIDIFMPSCANAEQFGERTLHVRVIRHGWNPKATDGI